MSDLRKDIPTPGAPNFDERVKETLSVALGYRGDVLDRMLTVRDLASANIITLKPGYLSAGRVDPVAGSGSAVQAAYQADLTPPPTPTGFIASASISNLIVGTDAPVLGMGHGYAKTILYGAKYTTGALPTFSAAVKLTEFTGQVGAYPTNPSTEWHLWVSWVTVDGVESPPAGGTNGVTVTTGQDVSSLLTALSGKITASQLYTDLGARINLIDAPSTGLVTLAANNATAISSEVTNRTNADSALAGQITTVQARLNTGDFAAVQVQSQASANAVTGLYAQYTVKTDVAGLVSGYGLASTNSGAAPTSSFGVRASSFFVAPPAVAQSTAPTTGLYAGYVWLDTSVTPNVTRYYDGAAFSISPQALPFVVQSSPTTVNGVTVPAGVYITDVYIRNGTITNAKIGNAQIDDAKISSLSVGKLVAGSIAVGSYINSSAYVSGSQGWSINSNGAAEFSNAVVRGAVYASSGSFTGNINADTGYFRGSVNTGGYTGYSWPASGQTGSHLSASGLLVGNANDGKYFQVTSTGDVYAPGFTIVGGSATFNGNFSGNGSGYFSGNVSANSISTNSGFFSVGANGKLTAIEADIQRRVVLQNGLYISPTNYYSTTVDDGYGTAIPLPAGTVVSMNPTRGILIATDIYDAYLTNTSVCQQYGVSLHAEGTTYYTGGNGDFQLSGVANTGVSRTFSVGGSNTSNDTRVYILINNLHCLLTGNGTTAFRFPNFRWKVYKL